MARKATINWDTMTFTPGPELMNEMYRLLAWGTLAAMGFLASNPFTTIALALLFADTACGLVHSENIRIISQMRRAAGNDSRLIADHVARAQKQVAKAVEDAAALNANLELIAQLRREAAEERAATLALIAQLHQAAINDAQLIFNQTARAHAQAEEIASLRAEIASLRDQLEAPLRISLVVKLPAPDAALEGQAAPDSLPEKEGEVCEA
ncbi:uncharacterized protein LOC62_03G003760 [Vanrija pseudolonga]|uniref:Uncharacterized protein n=1 Tax=Vanrija pseudolonga TaxID=143232 RepID=A0AAF1BL06_9TREE|nr:hypothetical protein LOC62_03G003760 [Vanrija pseudolonga]